MRALRDKRSNVVQQQKVIVSCAIGVSVPGHSMAGQGLDDVHSVVRPTTLCSCCGAVQLDDLRLRKLASHEAHDVRTPALQRAPALIEIQRFVVDASDAALVSANMTKDHLDHVRRDAEAIMQGSRQASPEI